MTPLVLSSVPSRVAGNTTVMKSRSSDLHRGKLISPNSPKFPPTPPVPPDPPPDPPPSKASEASPSLAHRRRPLTVTINTNPPELLPVHHCLVRDRSHLSYFRSRSATIEGFRSFSFSRTPPSNSHCHHQLSPCFACFASPLSCHGATSLLPRLFRLSFHSHHEIPQLSLPIVSLVHHRLSFNHLHYTKIPTTVVLPDFQTLRPPATSSRNGNCRFPDLVLDVFKNFFEMLFWVFNGTSSWHLSSICTNVDHHQPQAPSVNASVSTPPARTCRHDRRLGSQQVQWTSHSDLGLILGPQHLQNLQQYAPNPIELKMLLSTRTSSSMSTSSSHLISHIIHSNRIAQSSTMHLFTSSVVMASAITFKAAIIAASSLEIEHLSVFSESLSLVSLVTTTDDVNELRSILVDIYSLLEPFSNLSLYVVSSALVSALSTL